MTTENTENEQFTPEELAWLSKNGYKAPQQAETPPTIDPPADDPEAFTQAEQAYLDNLKNKKNGNK